MSFTSCIPQLAKPLIIMAILFVPGCARWVREPPGPSYKKFSELVHFPDFYPGLGTLYVQPATMPYGPFKGYDRRGILADTIYMIPIEDINKHDTIAMLEGTALPVDHVEIYFNSGHAGLDVPHYHIVLYHVSHEEQAKYLH